MKVSLVQGLFVSLCCALGCLDGFAQAQQGEPPLLPLTEAERKIAIVGIPDAQKGEAIILLSTIAGPALEQECIDLRYKLMDAGFPSLWCPKAIVPVQEIPVLASGKLDLKGCEELAQG